MLAMDQCVLILTFLFSFLLPTSLVVLRYCAIIPIPVHNKSYGEELVSCIGLLNYIVE